MERKTMTEKRIKKCCDAMESVYQYFKVYDNEPAFDTALYEENPVNIEHCPFCGCKLEIEEVTVIIDVYTKEEIEMWKRQNCFPQAYFDQLIAINNPFVFQKVEKE